LHRPYWFPVPAIILRLVLGEMSTLVVDGRFSAPKRLQEVGFRFRYPLLREALADIYN
jgi:NAD dependent epimerase/dehydratase family enzyme